MTTHVEHVEDENGELVDIEWFCSSICYEQHTGKSSHGKAWPGGSETDYHVYCTNCGELMWEGLES